MSPFSFIHCIRPVHPRGVGATAGPSVRHVRYSRERARKVFFCLLFFSSKRKVRSEKRKVRSEKSRAVKTDP